MQGLVQARFLAMDSSQLGDWSRDHTSADPTRRQAAFLFQQELFENGGVVLLSWHHFQELLSTRNLATAGTRVRFLQSLPVVGWIAQADGKEGLGTIVDILAAEAKAAFELRDADAIEVRDRVSKTLVKVGTGEQAIAPYASIWREAQSEFWAREQQDKQVVAIARSKAFDISALKVADLLEGRIRAPENIARALGVMHATLTHEIATRGDKRIARPEIVAEQFFGQVVAIATPLPNTARDLVLRGLSLMSIDLTDIGPETTMAEINDLSLFRKRLEVAAEASGLRPEQLRRLRMDQIPSWIVDSALRAHGQDLPERKGSELTDRYLACLAPYADITYVDKRTKENFRRATRRSPETRALVRRVEKTSTYTEIVRHLAP